MTATAQTTIHTDLPIWTGREGDRMWPRGFSDKESFGCASTVAVGDWKFTPADEESDESWWRFTNYGLFHCYMIGGEAEEREALGTARYDYGFFVHIGDEQVGGVLHQLWAWQSGMRPGSDYMLLSRAPRDGLITSFNVLNISCPRANIRDAGRIDIMSTAYCAINKRRDLIAFAKRMLRQPPAGRLVRVDEPVELNE